MVVLLTPIVLMVVGIPGYRHPGISYCFHGNQKFRQTEKPVIEDDVFFVTCHVHLKKCVEDKMTSNFPATEWGPLWPIVINRVMMSYGSSINGLKPMGT